MNTALMALLGQTAAAWYCAGFIWTLQVLNYPLLAWIAPEGVPSYETEHNRRFALVVAPGLLVAIVTTVVLWVRRHPAIPLSALATASALLAVIVVSTVLYQGPAHGMLATRFDPLVHARLVRTNWIRTVAWSAWGVLDLVLLLRVATLASRS